MQTIAERFRSHTQKVLSVNRTEAFWAMLHYDSSVANVAAEQELHIKMDAVGEGQWRCKISQKSEGDLKSVVVARAIPQHLRHITGSLGIQTSLGVLSDEESE